MFVCSIAISMLRRIVEANDQRRIHSLLNNINDINTTVIVAVSRSRELQPTGYQAHDNTR